MSLLRLPPLLIQIGTGSTSFTSVLTDFQSLVSNALKNFDFSIELIAIETFKFILSCSALNFYSFNFVKKSFVGNYYCASSSFFYFINFIFSLNSFRRSYVDYLAIELSELTPNYSVSNGKSFGIVTRWAQNSSSRSISTSS